MGAFPGWTDEPYEGSIFIKIFGVTPPSEVLDYKLEEYATNNEISYELRKVLPKLYHRDNRLANTARYWLEGKKMGGSDLNKLGLSPQDLNDAELEDSARDVVLSLSRLASPKVTLLVCIDEIEGMLSGLDDRAIIRSFTKSITSWIHEEGQRLFVTFLRSDTVGKLQVNGEPSHVQKMSQTTLTLEPLSWEDAIKIVNARLNIIPEWKELRKEHLQNQFWPLEESWLRDLYKRESDVLTPRHLIRACMVEVDRFLKGTGGPTGRGGGGPIIDPPPSLPLDAILQSKWDKQRATYLKKTASIHFDPVVEHTLRWLVGICDAPHTLADSIDKSIGDVNLVFKGAKAKNSTIAVSLCDQELKSLWHRLKRLVEQQQKGKADKLFDKLFILRAKKSRMTDTAQKYLDQLEQGGATIYYLEQQQLVELATYHFMQTHMQKGEYTFDGKPVDAAVFNQWAKENLSSSVKEFAQSIFDLSNAPAPKPKPETKTSTRQTVLNFS